MSDVKRYNHDGDCVEEDEHGDYVLYSSYEKAEQRIKKLEAALGFYRALTSTCNRHGKDGDIARDKLAKDSGKKAEEALNKLEKD